MLAQDQVLVEIITAANLAGIEQARAGLLGFNTGTLALAAGLGITLKVGDEAVKVYENHEKALLRLKQAVDVVGASYPAATAQLNDFIGKNQAFIPDNNKAIDTYALLVRSTGDYKLALLALGDVMRLYAISPTKDWDQATQAVNLGLQGQGRGLKEFGIQIAALKNDVANVTDAHKEMAKAQKEVEAATKAHEDAVRKLAEMQAGTGRPGHKQTAEEAMKLADAHKKVNDEATRLANANAALSQSEKDVAASTTLANQVHQQLADKLAGETPTLTDNQKAVNQLNGQWQEFATKIGPGVVTTITDITKAATTALGILSVLYDLQVKLATGVRGVATGSGRNDTFNPPIPYSGGAPASSVAPAPTNTVNVTNNISGQSDPQATANEVSIRMRGLMGV